MHSHHSHSGDYVAHAKDKLEDIVQRALDRGFTHFCLTEHMPRLQNRFIYPEEAELKYDIDTLAEIFDKYYNHAINLRNKYNTSLLMKVLVGFEVEGIDDLHIEYALKLINQYNLDMTIGSVHFVNLIPIDFDQDLWYKARDSLSPATTRNLYVEYFELQYKVICSLKPSVIGHFDLIRLFEPSDELDPTTGKLLRDIHVESDWPDVWELALRNIKYVVSYGGLFELNSAAIRKGWSSPYPKSDFATLIHQSGGKFCFSDDCHSIDQVGLNYHKVLDYIHTLGLTSIYFLDLDDSNLTFVNSIPVSQVASSPFWNQYK